MKFGQVDDPSVVKFESESANASRWPRDDVGRSFNVFVGCSTWNKSHLKGFYPPGVKNELGYYSTQFNSIELNATFFRLFPPSTIQQWRNQSAPGFKFFPKILQEISHFRRLNDFETLASEFIESVSYLEERLGVAFLQFHDQFRPGAENDRFDHNGLTRVKSFIDYWQARCKIPLAIEARHTDWHNVPAVSKQYYSILEEKQVANIIIDTAGRRDLLHMRLTTKTAFIRFVGCNNHPVDFKRLDQWATRIAQWRANGLAEVYFFLHEHVEQNSPRHAAQFIRRLNVEAGLTLDEPTILEPTLTDASDAGLAS